MKRLMVLVMTLCLLASFCAFAENALPLTTDPVTLTVFCVLDSKASVSISSLEENEAMRHFEEISGVDIVWYHPSSANSIGESVNLVLASGDLPDIIYNINDGSDNLDTLIENELILDLTDLVEQYCPNLMKIIAENPDLRAQITTYDGHIGCLPTMRLAENTRYFESFIIRGDWLEKLELGYPTTTEEWYNVLTAFKTKDPNGNGKADELPFVGNTNEEMSVYRLSSLWGFNGCYYKQYATSIFDGDVTFAIDAPGFDEWVAEMAKWYAEGLIDPEYVSCDSTSWKEKVLTDRAGSFYGKMNGGIGSLMGSYNSANGPTDFSLNPVGYAVQEDGKSYDFYSQDIYDRGGCAISTSCKNVEIALKWVDYMYSPEGQILASFGVEGDTFEYDADGAPCYTAKITDDPDLSMVQAIAKYTIGGIAPRMVNDTYYWNAVMSYDQQRQVYPTVSVSSTERKVCQNMTYSQDDAARLVSLMGDIGTYYKENLNAFIMGNKPLSELEQFKKVLHEQMNLDEAMKIMQKAYDNYIAG